MNHLPEAARRRMLSQPESVHPDAGLLTAFTEQSLTAHERELVLHHLAACATCREVVSLALPIEIPEAAAPVATSWFRWPMLRWAAVAATAVIVWAAVSVLVPRSANRDVSVPTESADSVAMPKAAPPVSTNKPLQAPAPAVGRTRGSLDSPAPAERKKASGGSAQYALDSASRVPPTRDAEKEESAKDQQLQARSNAPVSREAVVDTNGAAAPPSESVMGAAAGVTPPPVPPAKAQAQVSASSSPSALSDAMAAKTMANTSLAKHWQVTTGGTIESSTDGNTWTAVGTAPKAVFHTVAALGAHVWAGGAGGVLYRSNDGGVTWKRVPVGPKDAPITEAITSIAFSTPTAGAVTTASGTVWTTRDAGRSWQRP